jgi:hypothetical protein
MLCHCAPSDVLEALDAAYPTYTETGTPDRLLGAVNHRFYSAGSIDKRKLSSQRLPFTDMTL